MAHHHGRGATKDPHARFLSLRVLPADDGWGSDPAVGTPKTVVTPERTKTILSANDSPDIPFSASINPYKGCEHGCIYCYARPTHAYLDLSPGIDFETRITSKPEAALRLRETLARASYIPTPIALGANTDAYQPIERSLGITRQIMQVLADARHPVTIITKSSGVLRDLDLLTELARHDAANVFISVTTLDPELARTLEPRAASPARRLDTIAQLRAAGIPTGVLMAPIIPGLTDAELEDIVAAAVDVGAQAIGSVLLRLPLELKELFEGWLDTHVPEKKDRILSLLRQCRDGALYQSDFATRHTGTGPVAALILQRLALATRRHGLTDRMATLSTASFRRPQMGPQLSLFDTQRS